MNPEMLIGTRTEVLVLWKVNNSPTDGRTALLLKQLNLPFVFVTAGSMYDYPNAIRFLGKLTHRERRTEEMARYTARFWPTSARR